MLFLGSSLGEYAQAGKPLGVLGRKDVGSMKGTPLPIFQYLTFLMFIMGMGLTWLQVQYHMNNSRSPWDIVSTSLPQDPKKRLEMLFANLKEAMNSIAFSVSLEDPLLSLIQ